MDAEIETKKRGVFRRLGISLLNLVTPGLGLIRLGHYPLGFAILAVSLLVMPLTFFVCSRLQFQTFNTIMPATFFVFAVFLVCSLISIVMAWRGSAHLGARQGLLWRWYSLLGIWVLTSGISYDFTERGLSEIYHNFSVPSKSMEPNLVVGDRLVAKMGDIGQISRGDIVIMAKDGKDIHEAAFIKRVAAIPGDTFSMKAGVVSLNGKPVTLQPLGDVEPAASGNKPAIKRFREQFPGEAAGHEILDFGPMALDDYAEIRLGERQYFLLGDNRDNSSDSRVDQMMGGLGIVYEPQIKGRALFRYWRRGVGLQEGKL